MTFVTESHFVDLASYFPPSHISYPGVEHTDITLSEWLDKWFSNKQNGISKQCLDSHVYYIRLIKEELGMLPLQEITFTQVQNTANRLLEKGVAESSVRSAIGLLSVSFRDAKARRFLGYNPCLSVNLPSRSRRIRDGMTNEEFTELLNSCKGSPIENLLPVTAYGALRIGEALALSWKNVDFLHNSLKISQSMAHRSSQSIEIINDTKNSRSRLIYPPKALFDSLRAEQDKQSKYSAAQSGVWKNTNNLVFTRHDGRPMCYNYVLHYFVKARTSVNLERIHIHDLRHVGAVLKYKETGDIRAVKEYLGHKYLATTAAYLYCTPDEIEENVQTLEAFYQSFLI